MSEPWPVGLLLLFGRIAAWATLLLYAVLRILLDYLYSSTDNVLSMTEILFVQKFAVFFGFVYLFTIYKNAEFHVISISRELFVR